LTPSRISTAAVAAHPNKTAAFFSGTWHGWATGKTCSEPYIGRFQAAQGLEAPPRTSTSHWLRILKADLQLLNHGLNSAWRLAQDREVIDGGSLC